MKWPKLHDISLRKKLMFSFTTILICAILTISWSSYAIAARYVEQNEMKWLLRNLQQASNVMDFQLTVYMKKSDILFNNTLFQETLAQTYTDIDMVSNAYANVIYKVIRSIFEETGYTEGSFSTKSATAAEAVIPVIYVDNDSLPKDGGGIRDMQEMAANAWYPAFLSSKKTFYWLANQSGQSTYISMNRKLMDFKTIKQLGMLDLNISTGIFKGIFSRNDQFVSGQIFYFDESGQTVFSYPDKPASFQTGELSAHAWDGKEGYFKYKNGSDNYIAAYTTSDVTGWRLVSLYRTDLVAEKLAPITKITLVVLILTLLCSFILTYFVSSAITKRISKVVSQIRRFQAKGVDGEETRSVTGNDEIGVLDNSFVQMTKRINELIQHDYKSKLVARSMEVELLQAQINPHLLYNTLALIKRKAKRLGAEDIFQTTERLIFFYRNFLHNGELITSVSEEISMIRDYIEILKFTYNVQFEAAFQIEESIEPCYTIKLFLQPIIENAIVHGLRPVHTEGRLDIKGYRSEGNVVFQVTDNGAGIPGEQLDGLNKAMLDGSGGYGLSNIMKRIKLYFGEEYGISIESVYGEGTVVTVILPFMTKEEVARLFRFADRLRME
ncbi:sensor histidine kinase [Cohnella sp. GCM10020058]|uniref:sensor histidine kinase n=1 Tax=Cohnella sp. GCM10020058 TaxID=3317330 RepID=UPI0036354BA8